MRRLYLLRHAKSSWDEPALNDRERRLAPRGKRGAKLIRRHLQEHRIRPELVICSPAERARQTLAGIAVALGGSTRIEVDEELYTFSARELLVSVQAVDPKLDSALVIGHNPAMHDLALHLAESGEQLEALARKFPTAALATLEFECHWAELGARTARLSEFVRPKDLAATK